MRASIQFALNQILQAHVLQASADTTGEVALRKFEKRVDTTGIDQSARGIARPISRQKASIAQCRFYMCKVAPVLE
jgi:hypothetical protein